VKSCTRKGSLDADIKGEEPNDICGFCQQHPSIRRIVLANGSTGSSLFNKHFKEWWDSGELCSANDDFSQRAFGKQQKRAQTLAAKRGSKGDSTTTITCICAIGVSPAAARYSYKEKRDFWEQHVYAPGLQDYKQSFSTLKQEEESS